MPIYLKSFELKQVYREINPFSVKFREGLNIVVGENGSGKSTLLSLIMSTDDNIKKDVNVVPVEYHFIDTEKHNPRILGSTEYSKNIRFTLYSKFTSHGEAMLPLMEASKEFADNLIFIDEPEAGISLSNQKKVLKALETTVGNNCQVIITTHSYVLISSVKEVFNMDTKKWVSSKEYLAEVLKPIS